MPSNTFIANMEKSAPGFNGQTLSCQRLMQLVTLSSSQCSFSILKILGPSGIIVPSFSVFYGWGDKSQDKNISIYITISRVF